MKRWLVVTGRESRCFSGVFLQDELILQHQHALLDPDTDVFRSKVASVCRLMGRTVHQCRLRLLFLLGVGVLGELEPE